jgi:DNA-nicking Smr family endonuclease
MKEIDLHGIKHENVTKLLDSFLYEHLTKRTDYITIITGNSDKMKELVLSILKEYNLSGTESMNNSGSLHVSLI